MRDNPYKDLPPLERRPDGSLYRMTSAQRKQAVLQEAGLTLDNVVKTTVFVQDLGDFGTVNEIYGTYFHGGFPARSCVQIAALPKGALVEIECIAVR